MVRQKPLVVRAFEEADIEAYVRLQAMEWGPEMGATLPMIESRFRTYPSGLLLAESDSGIAGISTFIRIDYDPLLRPAWADLCDSGWCTNHLDDGSIHFGVDLTIARGAPRDTIRILMDAAIQLSVRSDSEGLLWGSRIPRYHKYKNVMTPYEYVAAKRKNGRCLDPELEIYRKIPNLLLGPVVPEYFKDWESDNVGVMVMWRNPAALS